MLSEESILLAQRWKALEDVIKALYQLRSDVERVLFSVEPLLRQKPWWDRGWHFVRAPAADEYCGEVYITRSSWLVGREPVIRIGVEGFTPEALFGSDHIATLYVKVVGRHPELMERLLKYIAAHDPGTFGDIGNGNRGYIVTALVDHCPPDYVEQLPLRSAKQVVGFIDHYARLLASWSWDGRR